MRTTSSSSEASKSLILSTAEHGLGGRHTGLGSVALTVAAMCIVFSIWVGAAAFLGPLNKKCDALELEVVAEEEKHLRGLQEMHAAMDLLQRTSFESSAGGRGERGQTLRPKPTRRARRPPSLWHTRWRAVWRSGSGGGGAAHR